MTRTRFRPPFRRLAIAACLITGSVLTLRALTPNVVATPAVSSDGAAVRWPSEAVGTDSGTGEREKVSANL